MKTNNFIINPLVLTDAHQLHQLISDNSEHLKYYFPKTLSANSTLEKTKEYITVKSKEIVEKSNFTFAIKEKKSEKIVGLILIKKIDWDKKQGELAYCIALEFEGKRITSFAVNEMIQFAFEELGLKTFQIITHKSNFGSIKVAENNGFVWRKTLKKEFTPTDELPLDMELYELTM